MADDNTPQREMPRYKCHKEVFALKIAKIDIYRDGGSADLTPAEEGYDRFHVSKEWMKRHNPEVGGYYVVYQDGYKSFSPPEAFEHGYTRIY